jgi:hypothetical protein
MQNFLRLHRSVRSNFGSDRFACITQICVVQDGLSGKKIMTSRCLLAFFLPVYLAVVRLLSSYFASLAKYLFQVALIVRPPCTSADPDKLYLWDCCYSLVLYCCLCAILPLAVRVETLNCD